MKIKEKAVQCEFACPLCKGISFVFIGLQKQKGLFNNHELWNCKTCHSTFARESIEMKKTVENETFHKKAFPFYCGFKFSRK
ncbi:MAG: hypothetical protein MRJ65_16600 [Candidatus Brocadiaceae bacterium]|nr:hypothetical protein [Candidatus Brocadiaceae bacterium]